MESTGCRNWGVALLGSHPEYAKKNYAAFTAENRADDAKKAQMKNKATTNAAGEAWDQWADLMWMYRALTDPAEALRPFEGRAPEFQREGGNSLANVYAWLTAFEAFGQVDRTTTADAVFHAVFNKAGGCTYAAYNSSSKPRRLRFLMEWS